MAVAASRDDGPVETASDPPAAVEQRMALVIAALGRDLQKIRVGGASGSLIDAIEVDHKGQRKRLIELASVTVPDPRQIVIRPWDPGSLRAIGTAISLSRIGLTPTIDGGAIRLYVPAMTEDRRNELAGLVRIRVERAHVEIRTIRHEALRSVRARERKHSAGSDDVHRELELLQRSSDRFAAEIDRLGREKVDTILRI
jgi:ribosome recycling factor